MEAIALHSNGERCGHLELIITSSSPTELFQLLAVTFSKRKSSCYYRGRDLTDLLSFPLSFLVGNFQRFPPLSPLPQKRVPPFTYTLQRLFLNSPLEKCTNEEIPSKQKTNAVILANSSKNGLSCTQLYDQPSKQKTNAVTLTNSSKNGLSCMQLYDQ
ncbi:unnamed protein product, partial [Cyprideis torosa]